MPNKPTIAYIIVITSVLIAIVIVVVPMFKTSEQTIEQVATTTPAMATSTIPTDPLAGIDLTFPEATQEIEGLLRVEDGIADLSKIGAELLIVRRSSSSDSLVETGRFVFIRNNFYRDFCSEWNPEPLCLTVTPEDVTEFLIMTADKKTLLHKYKLTEGYSMLGFSFPGEATGDVYFDRTDDSIVKFDVFRYEGDVKKEIIKYKLDIKTGHISEWDRENSEHTWCTLIPKHTACY